MLLLLPTRICVSSFETRHFSKGYSTYAVQRRFSLADYNYKLTWFIAVLTNSTNLFTTVLLG